MGDDKDILGKADALLRRGSAPPGGSDTAGFPVLTDLFEAPSPAVPAASEPLDGPARELQARVLAEVEARLAADLEARIGRELAPQVQAAVAAAIRELHHDLANAVGDAVAEAMKSRRLK